MERLIMRNEIHSTLFGTYTHGEAMADAARYRAEAFASPCASMWAGFVARLYWRAAIERARVARLAAQAR